MIEIDGSQMEGGGQIIRSALCLSSILSVPVRIGKIRAKRKNPGLQAQHIACVNALAEMTNAQASGAVKGSGELEFAPKGISASDMLIDVGTAGSVTLVLQALLPVLVFSSRGVKVRLKGGTHVAWSPSFDYFENVFIPHVLRMGCKIKAKLANAGWYPEGGGVVEVEAEPSLCLKRLEIKERGKLAGISLVSCASNLPEHVIDRQASAAASELVKAGFEPKIEKRALASISKGSCLTAWAEFENCILGASALGKIGKSAEEVGKEAASKLVAEIRSNATVDRHMADQILAYAALAEGSSEFAVSELGMHAKTNMWIIEKFLGKVFEVDEGEGRISVNGVGYKNKHLK